jgi:hypothetical protein
MNPTLRNFDWGEFAIVVVFAFAELYLYGFSWALVGGAYTMPESEWR